VRQTAVIRTLSATPRCFGAARAFVLRPLARVRGALISPARGALWYNPEALDRRAFLRTLAGGAVAAVTAPIATRGLVHTTTASYSNCAGRALNVEALMGALGMFDEIRDNPHYVITPRFILP
jgi:hypothetical protein